MSWQNAPEKPKTVTELLDSLPEVLLEEPRVRECIGMIHLFREMEFEEMIVRRMFVDFWKGGQK